MFIVFSSIYLLISSVLQIKANELKKNEVIKNEERLISLEQNIVSYRIDRIISDLLYISDNLRFHNFDTDELKNIENEWKSFSDRIKIYDQIRYIDIEGNSSKSEYTEESIKNYYKDNKLEQQIINKVNEISSDKKAILIFVPSIEQAKELHEKIKESASISDN